MKILIVSSEVYPFAKTGGLADVAGALPLQLASFGHDVRVTMPRFAAVDEVKFNLLPILDDVRVRLGDYGELIADIRRTTFPDSAVPCYFVENPQFFDRDGLYIDPATGAEYIDNALRFAFFCKAVIWLMKGLDWVPDVIQCNDWQTGLLPVMLRTEYDMYSDPELARIKLLFTIHNQAYQGVFPREEFERLGFGHLIHPAALEFYGYGNCMKGGIIYADRISTVSRRYAEEIQTPEYGAGLEGVLQAHRNRLTGILNGIDTEMWNPASDGALPAHFSSEDLGGKARCKAALQQEMALPVRPEVPLLAVIGRLDPQKGFDLLARVIDEVMAADVQFVLLGTGAANLQQIFQNVARRYPEKAAVRLAFDNALAHRIEAGADIFLMPSRYEPCGLNQLYSLRYGTVPVVRRTGGLADSITDATSNNLIDSGEATGFIFDDYTPAALGRAIDRALTAFKDKPRWQKLMRNGMKKDFSWEVSARQYETLFRQMTGAMDETIVS